MHDRNFEILWQVIITFRRSRLSKRHLQIPPVVEAIMYIDSQSKVSAPMIATPSNPHPTLAVAALAVGVLVAPVLLPDGFVFRSDEPL